MGGIGRLSSVSGLLVVFAASAAGRSPAIESSTSLNTSDGKASMLADLLPLGNDQRDGETRLLAGTSVLRGRIYFGG